MDYNQNTHRRFSPIKIMLLTLWLCQLAIFLISLLPGVKSDCPDLENEFDIPHSSEALPALQFEEPSHQNSRKLYVGIIFDDDDLSSKYVVKLAMEGANRVLKESQYLSDYALVPLRINLKRGEMFKAIENSCTLLECGVVALIGPADPQNSLSIVSLASRFTIPYIAVHASNTAPQPKLVLCMHPFHGAFSKSLFDYICDKLKWDSLVLVHSGHASLLKFSPFISMYEGNLKLRQWDSTTGNAAAVMSGLKKTGNVNFLVDIPISDVNDFLVMALAYNMTTKDHSYFFTDLNVNMLNLKAFKVNSRFRISTISIISDATPTVPEPKLPQLKRYLRQHMREKFGADVESGMMATSALLYDSIVLLAKGLVKATTTSPIDSMKINCSAKVGDMWLPGLTLLNAMQSVDEKEFQGLTGSYHFSKDGNRPLFDMNILELSQGGFEKVATWDGNLKIGKDISTVNTFREETQNNFLRVITLEEAPFVMVIVRDAYGKPIESPYGWTGFCMELLREIAKVAKFNYTIRSTKKYDNLIKELRDNTSDLAMASLTITYNRSTEVDFTTPFMNLGGSIVFSKPERQSASLFSFLQPFSIEVWAYVICTYFIVTLSLFVISRLSKEEWQNPHPCDEDSPEIENPFILLSSFWFYVAALLNQGTEMAPHATSSRMLTGVWWFFALIIISTYTANLAAFLTVDNTKSPISSAEDLSEQTAIKYGTVANGSSQEFFRSSSISTFKKMGVFMDSIENAYAKNVNDGIARVKNGGYAFILESTMREYYIERNCELIPIGGLLDSKGYGVGLPKNSPWRDVISEAILLLQSDQSIDKLKRKWWKEYNITERCTGSDSSKEARELTVEQVGGIFIILVIGFVFSFLVAMLEFYAKMKNRLTGKELWNAMWRELKFAMRCMTSSKKPKHGSLLENPKPVTLQQLQSSVNEGAARRRNGPTTATVNASNEVTPFMSRATTHQSMSHGTPQYKPDYQYLNTNSQVSENLTDCESSNDTENSLTDQENTGWWESQEHSQMTPNKSQSNPQNSGHSCSQHRLPTLHGHLPAHQETFSSTDEM